MTLCGVAHIEAAIFIGGEEEEEETKDSEDEEDVGDHGEDTTTWVVRSYLVLYRISVFLKKIYYWYLLWAYV